MSYDELKAEWPCEDCEKHWFKSSNDNCTEDCDFHKAWLEFNRKDRIKI